MFVISRDTMLLCLQRRDTLLEGSVARTSQTFPMVSISQTLATFWLATLTATSSMWSCLPTTEVCWESSSVLMSRCPDVVVSRLQVRDMWSLWPRTITMFLSSTLSTLLESTNPPYFFRKINILHRLILFFETCAKRRIFTLENCSVLVMITSMLI